MEVVELRQYELRPGRREDLIALFDGHLIEPQERCGMTVLGQFRDIDRPDWFVWLRGFDDMSDRTTALEAFYYGPVWAEHRSAANDTMLDSDNVLLLRPAPTAGSAWEPRWDAGPQFELVEITVRPCAADEQAAAVARLVDAVAPAAIAAGGSPLACLVTETAANGFPALPVRENESVVVSVLGFAKRKDYEAYQAELEAPPGRADEVLRLVPTAGSRLGSGWASGRAAH
jgi:hypothetical protein